MNLLNNVKALETKIKTTEIALWGDGEMAKHQYETYPGLDERIGVVIYGIWNSTATPSTTAKNNIKIAKEEYVPVLAAIQSYVKEIEALEKTMGTTPYTPGRGEEWKEE